MSCEESTTSRSSSSRLSQFGLYRTIDARTEEFLKLSKKRQIRQGCACAVISTALTVTIVVAVFLIFEYNGYSDSNPEKESLNTSNVTKHTHKEKSRHEGTNRKLNKKKHIISTSTINLLNLLLKALNHTHNLEGQEKNANSPTIDKIDTTNIPFKKNVLSDIKKWMRIPNLRMVAENKAPSIFYYRNPRTNVKLATDTRKPSIYPWTDISKASEEVLEKSFTSLIETDRPQLPMITETTTTVPKNHMHCFDSNRQKSDCKCSKLRVFLCKLLSNIQELFPEVIINTSLCNVKSNIIIQKANTKNATASNLLYINSVTSFAPKPSNKSKAAEKSTAVEVFQEQTRKSYLQTNTNQPEKASEIEMKRNSLNKSTRIPLENQQRSVFQTNKIPEDTTTAVGPFIVEPELVEYLKYFIKSTTALSINKDEIQHKISKEIHVTETLDKSYTDITDLNKYYSKLFANDTNKSTNSTRRTNQHVLPSEKHAPKTLDSVTPRNFITVDTNNENQKYWKKNTIKLTNRKHESQDKLQNKKNKIVSNIQYQSVIKTMKKTTKRPQYTTITVRPYIPYRQYIEASELINIKSATRTSIATTGKHHKIKQNFATKNLLNEMTRSTELTTAKETSTAAATKRNDKSKQYFDSENRLEGAIRSIEITTQNELLTSTFASKNDNIEQVSDTKKNIDPMTTSTEITKQEGTSLAATATGHDEIEQNFNIETESEKTVRIKPQEETQKAATALKYYKIEEKEKTLDDQIIITEIIPQNEVLSTTNKIEQNLDTEQALDETIRNIEKNTYESTSMDTSLKECDKFKQNLENKQILDLPIKRTDITTQEGTSAAATITEQDKTVKILDTKKEDEKLQNRIKPTQTKTVSKYFKDDFYAVNKPFKDIKFARFDSFAANSNKHIILPYYKDLNFELFPVFKRHNTNAKKFDTKGSFLLNNDQRTPVDDFTDILSRNKKDDYLSASNEMVNIISSKNHSTTINKPQTKSSSIPIKNTSPVDWIFEIKMMNDKIKGTLEEHISEENQESNIVLGKSIKSQNQDLPEIFSTVDKHDIWTYNIDSDFLETTTSKLILNGNLDNYEIRNQSEVKITLPYTKLNENEQAISINQLYDTNESLLKYLNKTIKSKANETDNKQLNATFHSEESSFFEDRVQEKLKYLRDTKSNNNNNVDVTIKYVIPDELIVDGTEYNPSSMLPKSRPSYLEINRNFLNTGEDDDYQINKINYKQKRQNDDYIYDIFK